MAALWFRRSFRSALFLVFATLVLASASQTTDPAYLADMPSVDRVKAQIQGKDATDTAARQVAVFTYLQEYIKRINYNKNPRGTFSADELRVYRDYWTAADQIMKNYNKTHTPEEAKAFDQLQFNYTLNNGDQWSRQLIGPQSAAAYTGTLNEMGARQKAHVDSINRANEEAKAAAASGSNGGNSKWNDPTAVASRRCVELGGTMGGCATKGFGQGLVAMIGGQEMTDMVDSVEPTGVYLSGGYQNPAGGGSLGFALGSATIGCGKLVADPHGYKLTRTASSVQVTVSNLPSNIVLAMRPDGSLVGPGPMQVNGRIITGYSNSTTTLVHQDGSEAWGCNGAYGSCRTTTSTPIYANASARCTFGALAAPKPEHLQQGAAADDGSMIGGLTGFMTSIMTSADPGLRMNGKFVSPTGLILDFEGDAVTLDCGQAHIKAPYTIQNAPNEFRISVNNSGSPFVLTLAPDNTLHGSGTTTVNGRLLVNMDANANPIFRPAVATCSFNNFSSKSAAEYRALIPNPPAPGR